MNEKNNNLLLVIDTSTELDSLAYVKALEKQALREQSLQLHIDKLNNTVYQPENNLSVTYIMSHKPVNNQVWQPDNVETPLPLHDGYINW